jgi:hypothetical protein
MRVREWFDFADYESRLYAFNHFLSVVTGRNKMNIVAVFVDAVTKHLLALLVDKVNVIQHHNLFLPFNAGASLAKGLYFIPVKVYPLLFQAVNIHNIVRIGWRNGTIFAKFNGTIAPYVIQIVFFNERINHCGFARAGVADKKDIQIVHTDERAQEENEVWVNFKLVKQCGLVFIDK